MSAHRAVGLVLALLLAIGQAARASSLPAEDGYDLWLRYRAVEEPWKSRYRAELTQLVSTGESATLQAARAELRRGLRGLLGAEPTLARLTFTGWRPHRWNAAHLASRGAVES